MHFKQKHRTIFITSIFLLFILNGCKKIQNETSKNSDKYKFNEVIAKLIDIPDVPMQCKIKKFIQQEDDLKQFQIICECKNINCDDLINYYKAEMERVGWIFQSFYKVQNSLILVFLKPSGSTCVISLDNNQQLTITVMAKNNQ